MQYWNGTAWITLAPGTEGQGLNFCGGVPTWGTCPTLNITNPATGKIWMDRNLGATQIATSSTDEAAFGDLYQWGRGTDGHQLRTSATTSTLSSSDNPGHGNFILAPLANFNWRNPQNVNLWQGISGINNPCPAGYRLPTDGELDAERASWSSQNYAGAYTSPLKFTLSGLRFGSDGLIEGVNFMGNYWSGTIDGTTSRNLHFNSTGTAMYSNTRAHGFSVRCIKN